MLARRTKSIMELHSFSMPLLCPLLFLFLWASLVFSQENFLQCLLSHSENNVAPISSVIYTKSSSSYTSVLDFPFGNLRFSTPTTPKPLFIITPTHVSHIQATVNCSRKHDLQIRIRSGGHDYEGLSYVSQVPFVVVDLIEYRAIDVDVDSKTAWIQAGATIGELYYRIAEKSKTLAFPAGVCPTVGVGGHFSGGGYGMLMRKFGLVVDHIIDAHLVDVNGSILDRKSMGEDLFWSIRGGGGGSFGVLTSWKVKLVSVPSMVTVFTITKTLEENTIKLIHNWQYVAPKSPQELFFRVISTNRTQITFTALFLGGMVQLIKFMKSHFPELGLREQHCSEMSWIDSTIYFADIPNDSPTEILLNRTSYRETFFKVKSDYVKAPMPGTVLKELYETFLEQNPAGSSVDLTLTPYGGKMDEISESATPFPHRRGNQFMIFYKVVWEEKDDSEAQKNLDWIRRVYSNMEPYVSKSPREVYVNYRDLDIGSNGEGKYISYKEASKWGVIYFKNNFNRLVRVKTKIDPPNFFMNEQSIPSLRPSH